jgi:hypothetical protein
MDLNTDLSNLPAIASANTAQRISDAVSVAVLKKALTAEQTSALTLLQALPPIQSSKLFSQLGQNIDTFA